MINLKKTLKKSLGQNFLINTQLCEEIVNVVPDTSDRTILEIGCGNGALTKYLVKKKALKYVIVELDARWAKYIQEEFAAHHTHVEVKNENILDFQTQEKRYSIVGNIPYNITHLILKKIIEWYRLVDDFTIMVQEEVAQKLIQKKGAGYTPISVLMQLLFHLKLHQKINPSEFVPAPKVFSRIIQGKKNPQIEYEKINSFKLFLEKIFHFPRKKIRNQGLPADRVGLFSEEILEKRAQEMTPSQLYALFLDTEKKLSH
jgi:16S rRNA (adenine1518-N6/adenine1519-N6)-dimethyltransferase